MIRTDRRLRLCTAALVCLLSFIWGNSLLPASASRAFSDWVGWILGILPRDSVPDSPGSGLLRKAAHFTEFAALGVLLAWRCGMLRQGKLRPFFLGAAAACVDETIQVFVPERGPGIKDVCIDAFGVLTGMILMYLGHTYLKRKNIKHSLEEL